MKLGKIFFLVVMLFSSHSTAYGADKPSDNSSLSDRSASVANSDSGTVNAAPTKAPPPPPPPPPSPQTPAQTSHAGGCPDGGSGEHAVSPSC